jgi:ribosomal protein L16 Arg81 hydroxylase
MLPPPCCLSQVLNGTCDKQAMGAGEKLYLPRRGQDKPVPLKDIADWDAGVGPLKQAQLCKGVSWFSVWIATEPQLVNRSRRQDQHTTPPSRNIISYHIKLVNTLREKRLFRSKYRKILRTQ